jgi:hypothetical protein
MKLFILHNFSESAMILTDFYEKKLSLRTKFKDMALQKRYI